MRSYNPILELKKKKKRERKSFTLSGLKRNFYKLKPFNCTPPIKLFSAHIVFILELELKIFD